MTKTTKHGTFQVTNEFHTAVEAYRVSRGLRSWSAALLQLATIGYQSEVGSEPPKAANAWGGDRRSGELSDRLSSEAHQSRVMSTRGRRRGE